MCPLERVRQISKAMHVLNFIIAFAFEVEPIKCNKRSLEIIVITSDSAAGFAYSLVVSPTYPRQDD